MIGPILAHIAHRGLKTIRILDVASGGGDVPLELARRILALGYTPDLTLVDQSDVGLGSTVERARKLGLSAHAHIGNALEALPAGAYDAITCSLFLHHLDYNQCVKLLSNMKHSAGGIVVINDLVRCRIGLIAATVGCHLLSRSPLVHHDGPASARAAWTPGELYDIAQHAGLSGAVIRRCFPWRMLFTWKA